MSATVVEICNSAIAKVRGKALLTLDDKTTEGNLCKQLYPRVRDRQLRLHPWNFAVKRQALAASIDKPAYEYQYQFPLPNDFLRLVETNISPEEKWVLEDNKILANRQDVKLKYIHRADESKWDYCFDEVVSYALALELAYAITQNATLKQDIREGYNAVLREARTMNAQERGHVRQITADAWLNSRF